MRMALLLFATQLGVMAATSYAVAATLTPRIHPLGVILIAVASGFAVDELLKGILRKIIGLK